MKKACEKIEKGLYYDLQNLGARISFASIFFPFFIESREVSHMKKGVRVNRIGLVPLLESSFFLCAVAILGGIIGCILVSNADEDSAAQLASFLKEYMDCAATSNLSAPYFDLLLQWGGRFGLALLIEWSALRVLGLPVFLFLQGIIVSFAISSFVAVFGVLGLAAAFVLFGMPTLFFFSGLFCIHWQLAGRIYDKQQHSTEVWTVIGVFLLCLVAIVLSECIFVVNLLPAAAKLAGSFHGV